MAYQCLMWTNHHMCLLPTGESSPMITVLIGLKIGSYSLTGNTDNTMVQVDHLEG